MQKLAEFLSGMGFGEKLLNKTRAQTVRRATRSIPLTLRRCDFLARGFPSRSECLCLRQRERKRILTAPSQHKPFHFSVVYDEKRGLRRLRGGRCEVPDKKVRSKASRTAP